jgi:hypothetical protein
MSSSADMASPTLAKPLDAAATLRITAIEDFVIAGVIRAIGVVQTLGDDALQAASTTAR